MTTEAELKKQYAEARKLLTKCDEALASMTLVRDEQVSICKNLLKELDHIKEAKDSADSKKKLEEINESLNNLGINSNIVTKAKETYLELPITGLYRSLKLNCSEGRATVFGCPTAFLGSKKEMWAVAGLKRMQVNEKSIDRIVNKLYKQTKEQK